MAGAIDIVVNPFTPDDSAYRRWLAEREREEREASLAAIAATDRGTVAEKKKRSATDKPKVAERKDAGADGKGQEQLNREIDKMLEEWEENRQLRKDIYLPRFSPLDEEYYSD